MKKTILLLLALLVYCGSDAQQIQTARNYVATNIVTNGANQITAVKLNTALNLMLNADSVNYKIVMDSMGKYTLLRDSTTKFVTPYQLSTGLATKQNALGYTAESTSNKTTDANGSSNALYPTQGAVKTYVDAVRSALVDSSAVLRALAGNGGGGVVVDTQYLRNDINQRVKYSDTAAMLIGYVRSARLDDTAAAIRAAIGEGGGAPATDTSNLSARIDARVKYSDTAGMLSNLYSIAAAKVRYADTAAMLANLYTIAATKVKYSDTAAMLSNLYAIAASMVKYADTAAMLGNLYTIAASKVKYSDTAGMLSPYLRSASAAATYAPISTTVTLTGTQTLTNKTLTSPSIATPLVTGLSSGTANDSVLVADASTGAVKRRNAADFSGSGSGISGLTASYLPKATSSTTLANSRIFDNGTFISLGGNTQYTFAAPQVTIHGSATAIVDPGSGDAFVTQYFSNSWIVQGYGSNLLWAPDGSNVTVNDYNHHASAAFKVGGTTRASLLSPMSTASINAISSPATGLQAYDTDLKHQKNYDGAAWRHSPNVYTGTAAPSTTPLMVGDLFVDTTGKKIYCATGTSSSADWTILN